MPHYRSLFQTIKFIAKSTNYQVCGLLLWVFAGGMSLAAQNTGESFLDVSVDTFTPYVGQPIIYTWQLFLPAGMNAASAQITLPTFDGFGQDHLPAEEAQLQTINGHSMQMVQRQIVLYPLQIGTFTIESPRILLPETPFQSAVLLESAPITITILPLPQNAPLSFQNALGQFDVTAALSATSITVGQPVILTMTVTGTGNIQHIQRPNILLPELWRVVEQESALQPTSPLFGSRVFEWQLIPTQAGIHIIPAIEFGFLNPQTGSYESRSTVPLPIEVRADATAPQPTAQTITQNLATKPNIGLKPLPQHIAPLRAHLAVLDILLWLLPPVGAGILAFMRFSWSHPAQTPKPERMSGSRALQQAQAQLKMALTQPPKEASSTVATVILMYVSRKAGRSVERDMLKTTLTQLPTLMQKTLLDCLHHADAGCYAPISEQDVKLLVRDTLRVLVEVDKTWHA